MTPEEIAFIERSRPAFAQAEEMSVTQRALYGLATLPVRTLGIGGSPEEVSGINLPAPTSTAQALTTGIADVIAPSILRYMLLKRGIPAASTGSKLAQTLKQQTLFSASQLPEMEKGDIGMMALENLASAGLATNLRRAARLPALLGVHAATAPYWNAGGDSNMPGVINAIAGTTLGMFPRGPLKAMKFHPTLPSADPSLGPYIDPVTREAANFAQDAKVADALAQFKNRPAPPETFGPDDIFTPSERAAKPYTTPAFVGDPATAHINEAMAASNTLLRPVKRIGPEPYFDPISNQMVAPKPAAGSAEAIQTSLDASFADELIAAQALREQQALRQSPAGSDLLAENLARQETAITGPDLQRLKERAIMRGQPLPSENQILGTTHLSSKPLQAMTRDNMLFAMGRGAVVGAATAPLADPENPETFALPAFAALAAAFGPAAAKAMLKSRALKEVTYNGVQEIPNKPALHVHTDNKTGGTFSTRTQEPQEVLQGLQNLRKRYSESGAVDAGGDSKKLSMPQGFTSSKLDDGSLHMVRGNAAIRGRRVGDTVELVSISDPSKKYLVRTQEEFDSVADRIFKEAPPEPPLKAPLKKYLNAELRDIRDSEGLDAALIEGIKRLRALQLEETEMRNLYGTWGTPMPPSSLTSRGLVKQLSEGIDLLPDNMHPARIETRSDTRMSKYVPEFQALRSHSDKVTLAETRLRKELDRLVAEGKIDRVEGFGNKPGTSAVNYVPKEDVDNEILAALREERKALENPKPSTKRVPIDFDAAQVVPLAQDAKGLKPLKPKGEAGHFDWQAPLNRAIAGGVAGGIVSQPVSWMTGSDSRDTAVGAVLLGGAMAAFGPAIGKTIVKAMGEVKNFKPDEMIAWKGTSGNLTDRPIAALSRAAEIWANKGLSPNLQQLKTEARGKVNWLIQSADEALNSISFRYKPTDVFATRANKYLNGEMDETTLLTGLNEKDAGYAQAIITSRKAIDAAMDIYAKGVADPKKAGMIRGTMGEWVTRTFRLYTDKAFQPTEEAINSVVKEIHGTEYFKDMHQDAVRSHVEDFIRQAKQGDSFWKTVSNTDNKVTSAADYIFTQRKKLSPAWREFLGEITAPHERATMTLARIRPMAQAMGMVDELAQGAKHTDGTPFWFRTSQEYKSFREGIENQLLKSPDNTALQETLGRLKRYTPIGEDPRFGKLSHGVGSHDLLDIMRDPMYDSKWINNPIFQASMGINRMSKVANTVLHPVQTTRQFAQAPALLLLSRGITGVPDAAAFLRAKFSKQMTPAFNELEKELVENGIMTGDFISGELRGDVEQIFKRDGFGLSADLSNLTAGKMETESLWKALQKGYRGVQEIYRLPDVTVRVATYLAQRARLASEMGLPANSKEVQRAAAAFTDRYTMNYDKVVPLVRLARNIPMFNTYMTYTAEMLRIGKNLVEDAVLPTSSFGTRSHALASLGALAAIPMSLAAMSYANLSPKDRKELDQLKMLMPDYARGNIMFNPQKQKDGRWTWLDINPLLPHDSIVKMTTALKHGDYAAAAAVNPFASLEASPFLSTAAEQIVGKDLATHRDFRTGWKGWTDRFASLAKRFLPPLMPGTGSEWRKFDMAMKAELYDTERIVDKAGRSYSFGEWALPYATGVKAESRNLDALVKTRVSLLKRELANERAYLSDIMKQQGVPDEVKRERQEQYLKVEAEIRWQMLKYMSKP